MLICYQSPIDGENSAKSQDFGVSVANLLKPKPFCMTENQGQ